MSESMNPGFSGKMLLQLARGSRVNAYAPYSGYAVGASCVGETGVAYFGCNIENASYPAGICAERVAVSSAVAHGVKNIKILALAAGKDGREPDIDAIPCGFCLQFISEFMEPDGTILVAGEAEEFVEYKLSDLLSKSFRLKHQDGKACDE